MAQLTRPLTKQEIESLMKAPALALHAGFIEKFGGDRWPLMVHYRVGLEGSKPQFTPRNVWRSTGDGPSDCVWIIPGSTP